MKKTNRKGFTLVELVIVIAVIAILAGVLIATFASVIKKANDSARLQQAKNDEIAQKADDIIAKIENSNWFGWEDFEAEIVKTVAEAAKSGQLSLDEIKPVVEDAVKTALANIKVENTGLTAEDVKAIVENAMGSLKFEGVTEAQVRAIVNGGTATLLGNQLTAAQVRAIVNAANEQNLTAVQLANVLSSQLSGVATLEALNAKMGDLQTAITGATANLATKEDVQTILDTIENFETTVNSADLDDVITAKALKIRIKNAGLTRANTPYDVVSAIEATDSELKSTILLSISQEQFGFFVIDDSNKLVNSCGLNISVDADNKVENAYKYWAFADEVSNTYSTYLTGTDSYTTIEANGVGVDVGNTTVRAIEYKNDGEEHDVVIRTNGGSLTINAPSDVVKHYGEASNVNVIAVKSSSYHEYGVVAIIQVASGRIELEASADVDGIHINAKVISIADDGTVTYSTTEFADDITLTIGGKEVSLTRDSVGDANIGGNSKLLVCKVETETTSEYVWLDGDGTIENSNVYVSSNANGSDAVAVNSNNASDAAKAIANNAVNTGSEENPVYTPVDTGVTINTSDDTEVWATYESQAKLEYLINNTSFVNLKQIANIVDMTSVYVPANRIISIDTNGYTIDTALQSEGRHYYAFYNYGELTLQDSSEGKTSYIKARGIENLGGKMTINSGKYYNIDTNGGAAVWNENYRTPADDRGYWHIKPEYLEALVAQYGENEREFFEDACEEFDNNYIYVTSGYGVNAGTMGTASLYYKYEKEEKQADLTINGGEFIVEYVGEVKNGGPGVINSQAGTKLTLNGGNINSACQGCYAVIADGETIVNNITVYGAKGAFAVDSGTCVFNGGTFTSDLFYGCWITNDGTDTRVTINGGSFSGKYGVYSSVDDGGQDESNVAITINGGTFEGTSGSAVINTKATQNQFALLIYGGSYNTNPSVYVASSYTITESDGWFTVTK